MADDGIEPGHKLDNRVVGCTIHSTDTPLIVASVACFVTFLVYGACAGALGAALPSLAAHYNRTESQVGISFTARGIGYLIGTLGSAAIIEVPTKKVSKTLIVCLSIGLTGLATGIISLATDFNFALFLFFLQGIGFGGVDTSANCVMPELWKARVGPWMQALHSFFGLGAVIGPSLVGSLGFHQTFRILFVASFSPFLLMIVYRFMREETMNSAAVPVEELSDEDLKSSKENSPTNMDTIQLDVNVNEKVPLIIKILIATFFFLYVGTETGYGGWISTYALKVQVTRAKHKAAYVASAFWAALTFGRFLAIFLAILLSNTKMLRMQLILCILGSVLALFFASSSYIGIIIVSCVFGFALSSIFPLAMLLVADYGYTMDAPTTTLFVVGSTCGEAIIPIIIGVIMSADGPEQLPLVITILSGLLVALYVAVHKIASAGRATSASLTASHHKLMDDISVHCFDTNPIHDDEVDFVEIELNPIETKEESVII